METRTAVAFPFAKRAIPVATPVGAPRPDMNPSLVAPPDAYPSAPRSTIKALSWPLKAFYVYLGVEHLEQGGDGAPVSAGAADAEAAPEAAAPAAEASE